ncbi:MAG: flagellar type III secretion system protein FliR [Syntrophothermus sp.]|uniref:flagellar biosynthetic protein FliR n=1 Tax=Syntrophothermus sp. TaxID=2736299 RepID=UPI00257BA21D|nr:flagellar biosynthetic protein FliR [Syntrophothermus sp.]NSW82424.1 flagellar type III secretion system protein FliR [Syntrophothermus sp.]
MPLEIDKFLLVFARVSGLFLSAPVYSSRQIPVQIKVFLGLLLAAIITYVRPMSTRVELDNTGIFLVALAVEVFTGYALGLAGYVLFAAVQLAGQLVDMQMGFGIVNVMDPQSGMQVPLVGSFYYLLAILVFLGIDGHHQLLSAVYHSYDVIPILGAKFQPGFTAFLVKLGGYMFVLGVKIAAPVVAALLVADTALGFMARTVPQMNIFLVGMPLKILGGIVMLLLVIPVYVWLLQVLFAQFFDCLDQALYFLAR